MVPAETRERRKLEKEVALRRERCSTWNIGSPPVFVGILLLPKAIFNGGHNLRIMFHVEHYPGLAAESRLPDCQYPRFRLGNRHGFPLARQNRRGGRELAGTDQRSQTAPRCNQRSGGAKNTFKLFHRPESNQSRPVLKTLSPLLHDLHAAETQGPRQFPQKGGFLSVRLDERQPYGRSENL